MSNEKNAFATNTKGSNINPKVKYPNINGSLKPNTLGCICIYSKKEKEPEKYNINQFNKENLPFPRESVINTIHNSAKRTYLNLIFGFWNFLLPTNICATKKYIAKKPHSETAKSLVGRIYEIYKTKEKVENANLRIIKFNQIS